jgi:transcriptional regulator with XRE-family HTH domain
VNKKIGERIRRIRAGKGLSQANVAEDLGITSGAYAKIERGETDASSSRLMKIAEVLEVNIRDFFEDVSANKVMEEKNPYGFATKEEVNTLSKNIQALMREFEKLKMELTSKSSIKKKRKAT